MFKSVVIEWGYYLIIGIISGILEQYLNVSIWTFWVIAIFGMLYHVSLPLVRALAWGNEH